MEERLIRFGGGQPRAAEVNPDRDILGLDAQRALQRLDRFGETARFQAGAAEALMRPGVVRVQERGFARRRERILAATI